MYTGKKKKPSEKPFEVNKKKKKDEHLVQMVDKYLFNELDASLQIHTEIDKGPFDTLTFVLFLLKYEHVVVEELLQLLIGEIDAKLLETVVLFSVLSSHRMNKQ